MPPQATWSPTDHALAHHQFSHVTNLWKQGRQASFWLEALPGGQAELHLTFQFPPASEVVPPPSHVFHVPPQRPIQPLFPNGCSPQGSAAVPKTKPQASQKNFPQGSARAIDAQCSTGLPWLRLLFLPLKMAPYARLP